ncbi:MAG TPA: alpha-amylase family glycosyl hydrolase, partial [Candidatus Limnocylindrales bacterium]|nr:alpha-amylase family glycosyl hydrolase [Candidatus Limnocylindrales bacterium]
FVAQGHLNEPVVRAHHEYGGRVWVRDGAAFGHELERLIGLYDRAVTEVQLNLLGSHDSPRFRTMASEDRASYHLAVLLQATLPGAPCTYYGDEVGIVGGNDPDCRRAFPWDESAWDVEGLAWTRAVYAARRAQPALRRGAFRVAGAADAALAFVRDGDAGGQPVLVVVNAGEWPVEVPVGVEELGGATLVDAPLPDAVGRQPVEVGPDGRAAIGVPPRTGRLLTRSG